MRRAELDTAGPHPRSSSPPRQPDADAAAADAASVPRRTRRSATPSLSPLSPSKNRHQSPRLFAVATTRTAYEAASAPRLGGRGAKSVASPTRAWQVGRAPPPGARRRPSRPLSQHSGRRRTPRRGGGAGVRSQPGSSSKQSNKGKGQKATPRVEQRRRRGRGDGGHARASKFECGSGTLA